MQIQVPLKHFYFSQTNIDSKRSLKMKPSITEQLLNDKNKFHALNVFNACFKKLKATVPFLLHPQVSFVQFHIKCASQ